MFSLPWNNHSDIEAKMLGAAKTQVTRTFSGGTPKGYMEADINKYRKISLI